MPIMSGLEAGFCRSAPWQVFARKAVVPWAVGSLSGDVLEIGGGAGAMAQAVVESRPDVRLTVTDIDPEMVAAARRRLGPRARAEVADVTALPFDDASYDVVCSWLMLHHVVVWGDALPEVARVLRPGGRFVGYDLTDTVLSRVIHRIDGSEVAMIAAEDLEQRLVEVGFSDVRVRPAFAGQVMRFSAVRPGHLSVSRTPLYLPMQGNRASQRKCGSASRKSAVGRGFRYLGAPHPTLPGGIPPCFVHFRTSAARSPTATAASRSSSSSSSS